MLKRTRILLDRLHVEVLVLEYALAHVVIHAMAVLVSVPTHVLVVAHVRIHVTHRAIRDVLRIAQVRVLVVVVPLVKDARVNVLANVKAVPMDVVRLVRMDATDTAEMVASRTAILDVKAPAMQDVQAIVQEHVNHQRLQTHAVKAVVLLHVPLIAVRDAHRHVDLYAETHAHRVALTNVAHVEVIVDPAAPRDAVHRVTNRARANVMAIVALADLHMVAEVAPGIMVIPTIVLLDRA